MVLSENNPGLVHLGLNSQACVIVLMNGWPVRRWYPNEFTAEDAPLGLLLELAGNAEGLFAFHALAPLILFWAVSAFTLCLT